MSIDEHDEKGPRAATKDDLIALFRALSDHQVDYVLLGGQALNLHGYMRGTGDIDLLLPMDEINGRKIIDALSILPDNAAKDVDPEWLAESGTIRVADEIIVDLMTVAANGETYQSLKPHIQQREINGFSFFILDLEGLLKTKNSVRPKDKQDAAVLRSMILKASAHDTVNTKEKQSLGIFSFLSIDGKAFAVPVSDADRDRLAIGEIATFEVVRGARHCAIVAPPTPPGDDTVCPHGKNSDAKPG